MVKCNHCGAELTEKPNQVYECPRCHCKFRIVLVWFDPKCYAKQYPDKIKELKKEKGEKRKYGKRERPRKTD